MKEFIGIRWFTLKRVCNAETVFLPWCRHVTGVWDFRIWGLNPQLAHWLSRHRLKKILPHIQQHFINIKHNFNADYVIESVNEVSKGNGNNKGVPLTLVFWWGVQIQSWKYKGCDFNSLSPDDTIYATMNRVIIGSDKGLSPRWDMRQATTYRSGDSLITYPA